MQLIISARDQVLARYGNQLGALSEGQVRTALSRSLNHEGDKGRTQVKRALVKQTGIKYGAVARRVHDLGMPASQSELTRDMLDWFATKFGAVPDESTVRRRVQAAWRELTRPG
jgi:hypothetical protein